MKVAGREVIEELTHESKPFLRYTVTQGGVIEAN